MSKLYDEIRSRFPAIVQKADIEHIRLYYEVISDMSFLWFESLANAINLEMLKSAPANDYEELFKYISNNYLSGNQEDKEIIDVSFVENLFWKVPGEKAESYWQAMPNNLKKLYTDFHGYNPLPL